MGSQTIPDPGAEESENAEIGNTYVNVINGDSVTLTQGMVVAAKTGFAGTGAFNVVREPTAGDFFIIGVVAGQDIPVGGAGRVVTEGVAQVIMDGATTAGHLCLGSGTTAGDGTDNAAATLGKTVGTILNTIGSAGKAYVYVHKM
jgi:hypothetical protein